MSDKHGTVQLPAGRTSADRGASRSRWQRDEFTKAAQRWAETITPPHEREAFLIAAEKAADEWWPETKAGD